MSHRCVCPVIVCSALPETRNHDLTQLMPPPDGPVHVLFAFGDNTFGQLGVGCAENISSWCVDASEHRLALVPSQDTDSSDSDDGSTAYSALCPPPIPELSQLTTTAALLSAVHLQVWSHVRMDCALFIVGDARFFVFIGC